MHVFCKLAEFECAQHIDTIVGVILTNVTHPIGICNPHIMGISLARGLSFPLQNDMHKYLSIHGGKTW